MKPAHQFDRRKSDVNEKSFSTRLKALEDHVHEAMTPEIKASSRLSQQVHNALMGTGEDDSRSISFKVNQMHEAFTSAQGGLAALETMGRIAKPLAIIAALGGAVLTLFTTGHWTWPK